MRGMGNLTAFQRKNRREASPGSLRNLENQDMGNNWED